MVIQTRRRNLARAAARNISEVTKKLAPTSRKKITPTPSKNTKLTKPNKSEQQPSENNESSSDAPKIFNCSKCDAPFSKRIALAQHVRKHHKKWAKKTTASKEERTDDSDGELKVGLKKPKVESVNDLPDNDDETDSIECDVTVVEEADPQGSVLECYIVNENQENDPEFVDIFTIVEVKEEDMEPEDSKEESNDDEEEEEEEKENPESSKSAGSNRCNFCGRAFRHKKNIRPHINKKHPEKVIILVPDTSNYFSCDHCDRKFKYKKNLNAHTRLKHPEAVTRPTHDEERPFQCHLCDRKLKYKRNLNAHIRAKHLVVIQGDYICHSCDRRFLFRKNLLVHLRNKHPEEVEESPLHPCNTCEETFRTSSALRKHKSIKHPQPFPMSVFPKKCPLCDFFTSQKLPIIHHFAETHDIEVVTDHLEFTEMQAFFEWKERLEKETKCRYSKISTGRFEDHTTMIFQCHRSGRSRRSRRVDGVILQSSLSLKMNAYCPAQLYVIDYYSVIKVRYTSTHVGHDLIARPEPKKPVTLRTIENMIQEEITHSPPPYEKKRTSVHEEPKQIMVRVPNRSKLDEKTRNFEMKTIEDWIKVHQNDVLFYRKSGGAHTFDLGDGELILIIMGKEQQATMRKYAEKFVCVHTIHDSLKYEFAWTTMMVLDDQNEAVPVAFLVSSGTSIEVYQTFFQYIKAVVGAIHTNVFMGDRNEEMYLAWSEVTKPAEHFIFCPWLVLEDWKSNASKIRSDEKRKSVLSMLEKVRLEENYTLFEDHLNSFIECTDDEVREFREYFVENYMETIPSWAYCYRLGAQVEGNLTLDDFRKIFSPSKGPEERRELISVTEALLALDNYQVARNKTDEGRSLKIVELHGLISIIEENHKRALEIGLTADNIQKTDTGWLITMPNDVEQTYKIRRNEKVPCVECKFVCPACCVCFHRFTCSCANKNEVVMCDHIHFLGELLQKEESS